MPTQDTSRIKENILSYIKQRGPSLPVHIAKITGLSILFSSAFLSELLSERKIRISNMRVGSSPIYYIPGQENQLENFSRHLNSKEKEAFTLLQDKKILKDIEQDPAIRVALRSIKDFAVPFKKEEVIFWRYYLTSEEKAIIQEKEIPEQIKKTLVQKTEKPTEKKVEIFDEPKKKLKKIVAKTNEKFFNRVKDFLSQKNIEILDIESFNKNELVLKVKENEQEILLVAYNKKRVSEEDIIRAHKKVADMGLKYKILSLGEPLKKVHEFLAAINNLKSIEKINDNL